jgi:hypothetical protein
MDRVRQDSIKKLPPGRDKRLSEEAIVKFSGPADRDMVKGAAFRLAGKQGHSIRLEIPNHLLSQHRILSSVAHKLRQANQGSRTNIKFQDGEMTLVLDYRVGNDGQWKRLYPEQAAEVAQRQGTSVGTTRATAREFEELLTPRLTGGNAQNIVD